MYATIYAAQFPSVGKIQDYRYSGKGIAVYEIVVKYGTEEQIPKQMESALECFWQQLRSVQDPVFSTSGWLPRIFKINEGDLERRILRTSYDEDYEKIIEILEQLSQNFEVTLLKDDKAMPELSRWVPYLILRDRE